MKIFDRALQVQALTWVFGNEITGQKSKLSDTFCQAELLFRKIASIVGTPPVFCECLCDPAFCASHVID